MQAPFSPNRVVKGAVVKANEQATGEIATYVRTDQGLLLDRSAQLLAQRPDEDGSWQGWRKKLIAGTRSHSPTKAACTNNASDCRKASATCRSTSSRPWAAS